MPTRRLLFLAIAMSLSFQVALQAQHDATPADLNRRDLYKLTAIDAVNLNNKHTEQEMKVFQAEAESEFQKINLLLDWGNQRWYVIPRDNQLEPAEKKFRVEGGLLQFMDCRDCQDNTFTIEEHTDETLILHLQPQDEGQFFVFSFTFKK